VGATIYNGFPARGRAAAVPFVWYDNGLKAADAPSWKRKKPRPSRHPDGRDKGKISAAAVPVAPADT